MAGFLPRAFVLATSLVFTLTAVGVSPSSLALPIKSRIYPRGVVYAWMTMGDPPKTYLLHVDSGSNLAWVQCDGPCTECWKGPNGLYKPRTNGIVRPDAPICRLVPPPNPGGRKGDKCDYGARYADGSSTTGYVVTDYFVFPLSTSRPVLAFGCGCNQHAPTGTYFSEETDGLLGLGKDPTSIISQLAAQKVTRNEFSHCLSRTGSGILFLGDHPSHNAPGTSWARMSAPLRYYSVGTAASFVLGKRTLNIRESHPVAFDSGTTYTYFSSQTYGEFLSALLDDLSKKPLTAAVGSDPPRVKTTPCWKGPFESTLDVKKFFPSLFLNFGIGKDQVKILEIPPENYLYFKESGHACLGIFNGTGPIFGKLNLIGDISMQDLRIIYDNEKQMIGWAPADCTRIPG